MFFLQRKPLILESSKHFDVPLLSIDQMQSYCDLKKTVEAFSDHKRLSTDCK